MTKRTPPTPKAPPRVHRAPNSVIAPIDYVRPQSDRGSPGGLPPQGIKPSWPAKHTFMGVH